MSRNLLWRHIALLTVGVYSSNYRVLYSIGISMTWRFQKSVGPSVRLSICNAKKKPTPPLLTIEKSFTYLVKGHAIHYKKMKRYFQKNIFQNFRQNFRKNVYLHKMPTPPSL